MPDREDTFNDRNRLVLLAAVLADEAGYEVGLSDDGTDSVWPSVTIVLPTGPVSWRVPRPLLEQLPEYHALPHLPDNGHSTEERARRIMTWLTEWEPHLDEDPDLSPHDTEHRHRETESAS